MPIRILLDTNVLIDYLARREPFFETACKLRIAAHFDDVELWVCPQSFSDAEHVLRRAIPTDQLRSMMLGCLEFLHIAAPSAADLHDALASSWPDLEDFLIARGAERVKASYLLTRDEKGFTESNVTALSPAEFLDVLKKEHDIEYDELEL